MYIYYTCNTNINFCPYKQYSTHTILQNGKMQLNFFLSQGCDQVGAEDETNCNGSWVKLQLS